MSKIEQIVTEYTRVKKEFQEKASSAMKEAFTDFFMNNPNVMGIAWTQYTPYFNDGDECIFNVNEAYFTLNNVKPEDFSGCYDEENFHDSWSAKQNSIDHAAEVLNFWKELMTIPDEVFKETFGDHVEIYATREGFKVEEYDHD